MPTLSEDLLSADPARRNYATRENVQRRIKADLLPYLQYIRDRRATLDVDFDAFHNAWAMQHQEQGYVGRANIYVPACRRATEALIGQISTALFPTEDYFGVAAQGPGISDEDISQVKAVLRYDLEDAVKLRAKRKEFLRQLLIFGSSPVKVFWRDNRRVSLKRRRSALDRSLVEIAEVDDVTRVGPEWRAVNIRRFWAWPDNVDGLDHTEIQFEDFDEDEWTLKRREARGLYVNVEQAIASAMQSIGGEDAALQTNYRGIGDSVVQTSSLGPRRVGFSEVWCDFDIEGNGDPVPCFITVTREGVVLRASRHPLWHQMPPYLLGRIDTMTGELYGHSRIEPARYLQQLLNDQTNQAIDTATLILNPILQVLTGGVVDPSTIRFGPGAQWLVNQPGAVSAVPMPVELVGASQANASVTFQMIMDAMAAPPVIQGRQPESRGARTATGMQILQRNALTPLQDTVEDLELQVFEPTMKMLWQLEHQFRDGGVWAQITGRQKRFISPQQLLGDFDFKWLASAQVSNAQAKAAQSIQLLQIASQLVPILQAQGIQLRPAVLLRRIYTDVLGYKEPDEFLKEMGMAPQMMPNVGGNGAQMPSPAKRPESMGDEEGVVRDGAEAQAATFASPFGGGNVEGAMP